MKYMNHVDISCGDYASQWSLTDFYPESREMLRELLESGEDFKTDWFGPKKEITYAKITREAGTVYIEVGAYMDGLEDDSLIYDAICTVGGSEDEVTEKQLEEMRSRIDRELYDHYDVDAEHDAADATMENVCEWLDELEEEARAGSEKTYQRLCDIVMDVINRVPPYEEE